MTGATIKAIDRESVHRIHSGQVVLDLQGAVKELVENALDAGASSIDVRIKDHGLETIEVVDNGTGIEQEDWPSIGLKHHTSKLPSLEELAHVSTFGFRGEALSALCALCESVTIVTATADTVPMGAVIKLKRDGRVLDDTGRVARQRGTTVTLTGLFKPLPVRRKEFERTAKREFTKALSILTAYALIPAAATPDRGGVRLKVESIGSGRGGKRNTVLATDGRGTLPSSVTAVWGVKSLEGVMPVDLDLDVEVDKVMARREGISETSQKVHVTGLISSSIWGQGRTSADRQYTYINGRPCTLPKVMKAINETYKSFNTNQVPLAILDFQIPREGVDINVSPDKRTIFVHSEGNLINAIRSGLETLFQPTRSSFAIGGASSTAKTTHAAAQPADEEDAEDDDTPAPDSGSPAPRPATSITLLHHDVSEGEDELSLPSSQRTDPSSRSRRTRHVSPPTISRPVQQTLDTTVASWSPKKRAGTSAGSRSRATGRDAQRNLRKQLAGYASQALGVQDDEDMESGSDEDEEQPERDELEDDDDGDEASPTSAPAEEEEATSKVRSVRSSRTVSNVAATKRGTREPKEESAEIEDEDDVVMIDDVQLPDEETLSDQGHGIVDIVATHDSGDTPIEDTPRPNTELGANLNEGSTPLTPPTNGLPTNGVSFAQPDAVMSDEAETSEPSGYRDEIQSNAATGEATLQFDFDRLQRRYAARRHKRSPRTQRSAFSQLQKGAITSAAGVSNRDASAAEEALSRVISKSDFERMQVLGQFNKGFIIARLRHDKSDDLFIIDQHASDEKFNFETLQRTTVIKAQTLIKPRAMQLTAADEIIAMDNLPALKSNGFEVDIDEDAPPGRGERVVLRAMPVSKETTFDFTDLEQLLHLLSDAAPGQVVRCTKARAMFAMRACRKSVMIGKSLTKAQMVTLLRNMGTIDQPWNCPHGRPTMRHLCTLSPKESTDRIDWTNVVL